MYAPQQRQQLDTTQLLRVLHFRPGQVGKHYHAHAAEKREQTKWMLQRCTRWRQHEPISVVCSGVRQSGRVWSAAVYATLVTERS